MGYLDNNLQAGEDIKYIAKIHFYLFTQPAILLLLGIIFCSSSSWGFLYFLGLLVLFLGMVSLIQRILVKIGSVYAVTNKRVILKSGIISRTVVDIVLRKCEGLHIRQSIIGRIFNFGTITVTTGGITTSYFYIADPFRFKREINTQID